MSLFYSKYLSLKNQLGGAKNAEEKFCQKESAAVCICPDCAPERYKPKNLSKAFMNLLESKIKKGHNIGIPGHLINLPDKSINTFKGYIPSDKIDFSMLDRDSTTHKVLMLEDPKEFVKLLIADPNIAKQLNFTLLNSIIDNIFDFEPIKNILEQQRNILLNRVAIEFRSTANLYLGKLRLINICNKLIPDEIHDQLIFDNDLIYDLLMISILFYCETKKQENYLRLDQDFLTSLLPPEMVIKTIHKNMFWDYISEDEIIRNSFDEPIDMILPRMIIIPNSVEQIEHHAFERVQLERITIPKNVTHIGNYSFCQNELKEVIIPDSVVHIGNYSFSQNQLKKVIIPSSVKHIGEGAFSANYGLTNVTIPTSVTFIGEGVFRNNHFDIPD